MTHQELLDFFESCNPLTRKPTENFLTLKKHFDTHVLPRRKIINELDLFRDFKELQDNECYSSEFIQSVIRKEQAFARTVYTWGELSSIFAQESFSSEEARICTGQQLFITPYSIPFNDLPDYIYNQMVDTRFIDINLFYKVRSFWNFSHQCYIAIWYREDYRSSLPDFWVPSVPQKIWLSYVDDFILCWHKENETCYFVFLDTQ